MTQFHPCHLDAVRCQNSHVCDHVTTRVVLKWTMASKKINLKYDSDKLIDIAERCYANSIRSFRGEKGEY